MNEFRFFLLGKVRIRFHFRLELTKLLEVILPLHLPFWSRVISWDDKDCTILFNLMSDLREVFIFNNVIHRRWFWKTFFRLYLFFEHYSKFCKWFFQDIIIVIWKPCSILLYKESLTLHYERYWVLGICWLIYLFCQIINLFLINK